MISFDIVTTVDDVVDLLKASERAVQRVLDRATRKATAEARKRVRPQIPVDTGATRQHLRGFTFRDRLTGDRVGKVTVTQPRKHIMRFIEEGTKSHGKYGGPLPAQKILARVRGQIRDIIESIYQREVESELFRLTTGLRT